MIKPNMFPACSGISRNALAVLGCALMLIVAQAPSAMAADSKAQPAAADKAPSAPLAPTFEKVTSGEDGPYVLNLKNISKDTITATAQVLPSVTFHATAKVRNIPEHAIESGQIWTITELAATDKVIISAKGFAPLELTVP
jgi:hypothetical protein